MRLGAIQTWVGAQPEAQALEGLAVHGPFAPASQAWGLDAIAVAKPKASLSKEEAKVKEQTKQVVEAKLDLAAQGASSVGSAKGMAVALMAGDGLKASGEALKLSAETLAKNTAAAGTLGASGDALGAMAAVAKGDAYGAASAASSAVSKLGPALANSAVGVVASAFVLKSGDQKLKSAAKQVKESAMVLADPLGSGKQKVDAAVNLTTGMQQFANVGRTMGNAAIGLFQWGVARLGKLPGTGLMAAELKATAKVAAASPIGSLWAKANRILPWLNLAGVAVAGKNTWEVFHAPHSSTRSKAIAIGALAMSGVAVWAGFVLRGWSFLGVVGASVGVDLGLAWSRQKDQKASKADGNLPRKGVPLGPQSPLVAPTAPNLALKLPA